jgi:hypothetical protein
MVAISYATDYHSIYSSFFLINRTHILIKEAKNYIS